MLLLVSASPDHLTSPVARLERLLSDPSIMHRLRSKSAVRRFRLAAGLLCLEVLLLPASVGILLYALAAADEHLIRVAAAMFGVTLVSAFLQWLLGARTNCPLCVTPVLANRKCAKSRHAGKFMGSHRLYVAMSILFRKSFRCPYCNEPTSIEVRQRS